MMLFAQWKLWVAGAIFALVAATILYGTHLQGQVTKLKARAVTAEQQAVNNAEAVKAVDTYHETTTIIREKADHAVTDIQSAPGSDAVLDPDFRARLCNGLASMRNGPVCTSGPDPTNLP